MPALMWFRSDLRIRDNPALHAAAGAARDGLIAVFTICPGQWRTHHWGGAKVDFVLRSLQALQADLAACNIPLRIVRCDDFAAAPAGLLKLARMTKCSALYFNREYEVNEQHRDAAVRAAFEGAGLAVHAFDDQTILDVGAIRTGSGGFYSVFTPFRKRWYALLKDASLPAELPPPQRLRKLDLASDAAPARLSGFERPPDPALWPAGEQAAHQRLAAFAGEGLKEYADRRDAPAVDGTSGLSPYLACGVLSARQCLRVALAGNRGRVDTGSQGAVTWISELIWREFYRHILMGFPRVCRDQPFRPETARIGWSRDAAHFEAWCAGRTGFPIVDAGMRQLAATGWMHNRVRMIVAMFLTKDLFIDWRWGERFFMERLVDGDFASNNGGWQWSASTGTDAAPYFRVFNPARQGERYDPEGAYLRRWVPELAQVSPKVIHDPPADIRTACGYPAPLVDRSRTRERVVAAFRGLARRGG